MILAVVFLKLLNPHFFRSFDLPNNFCQDNQVISNQNVLRGLHYQLSHPQGKLVQVVSGSILDVAVDIRVGSATFGEHCAVNLSSKIRKYFIFQKVLHMDILFCPNFQLFYINVQIFIIQEMSMV